MDGWMGGGQFKLGDYNLNRACRLIGASIPVFMDSNAIEAPYTADSDSEASDSALPSSSSSSSTKPLDAQTTTANGTSGGDEDGDIGDGTGKETLT